MKRDLDKFKYSYFDFLIIGGGITGATIAWDASLRGYKVALVEKDDFGHATSMATSKLIHGGLRYLANFEFSLVRESLQERHFLTNIIQHLVRPLPFLFPVYSNISTPRWLIGIGLRLYDLLSFGKSMVKEESQKLPNHKWYSKKKALELEPNLSSDKLKGAFLYYDVQNIHPERMNIDFISSAVSKGAVAANHLEMTRLLIDEIKGRKEVKGARVRDRLNNDSEFMIQAKTILNCSGPWGNLILDKMRKKKESTLLLSKGIHILIPRKQNKHAIFIETKDNVHFFVIPWLSYTLLGTTDTHYEGSPDDLKVTSKEVEDFLRTVNQHYSIKLEKEDILHAYAGIRPLILDPSSGDPKNTYTTSRKHELIDHKKDGLHRLVSVMGGKYTTSRALAQAVVNYVQQTYKLGNFSCHSHTTPLKSADYKHSVAEYKKMLHRKWGNLFSVELINHLFEYYGTNCNKVLEIAKKSKDLKENIDPSSPRIKAEIHYAIEHESAYTLSDFLYRRCGWGNEGLKNIKILNNIADEMGKLLGWYSSQKRKEIKDYLNKQEIMNTA